MSGKGRCLPGRAMASKVNIEVDDEDVRRGHRSHMLQGKNEDTCAEADATATPPHMIDMQWKRCARLSHLEGWEVTREDADDSAWTVRFAPHHAANASLACLPIRCLRPA